MRPNMAVGIVVRQTLRRYVILSAVTRTGRFQVKDQ